MNPLTYLLKLNTEYISEEFFREDIRINERRHLVFSTADQLRLLGKSKRWYVDATSKVVKAPFTQLFSIHSFIRHGDSMKQVPLAYVLMSGKRKEDYVAVLEAIKSLTSVVVPEVVMDFEVAMWQAVRAVFEEAQIKGCVFHWVQAIWRRVQLLGLQEPYNKDEGTHSFIRMLMALPFIPPEHVMRALLQISASNTTSDTRLGDMCAYIHDTWISSRV